MLALPDSGIAAARLLTVGPDADVRSVSLARIRAGTRWNRSTSTPIGTVREPGLAVDAAGAAAYVVDAGGLVARIDLRDLSVTYHLGPFRGAEAGHAPILGCAGRAAGDRYARLDCAHDRSRGRLGARRRRAAPHRRYSTARRRDEDDQHG
jgi:hypothetical protein